MSNAILVLWFSLIGADRIDLAGGHAPFLLTPFIALTPLVLLAEAVRRERLGRPVLLPKVGQFYAIVSGTLVCVALLSSLLAIDVSTSASRSGLLFAQVLGTFAVAIFITDRENLFKILAAGAALSLLGFIVFDVAEVLWWIGRGPEMIRIGPIALRFDGLQNVGPIPRLPGLVNDANRAGLVLVVYAVLIARGLRRPWTTLALAANVILFILPLSRSATLTATAVAVVSVLTRRDLVRPRHVVAVTLAIAGCAALLLAMPSFSDRLAERTSSLSPVAERVSSDEGSAQGHVALIERGIDEGMSSLSRTAIGLGFGNAYIVLQDVFPGSKYGNFHSLYVTMYAESGVFALVLTLILMGVPLVNGGPWRSLVLGAWAFGVFYQPVTEPVFWFLLALAWIMAPRQSPLLLQPENDVGRAAIRDGKTVEEGRCAS